MVERGKNRLQQQFAGTRRPATLKIAILVAALAALVPSGAVAQKHSTSAKEQLAFGVDMAKRGLWSEALFRFRQAERLAPDKPSVYNNLAVAHEAIGLFEEALALYRKGLELDPRDKGLRNNYARFIDFYNRFKPDEETDAAAEETSAGDPAQLAAGEPPVAAEPPVIDRALSSPASGNLRLSSDPERNRRR